MPEQPTPEGLRPPEQTPVDTRKRRVDALSEKMETLFEGEHNRELRERIERSFLVPQWGEYHNEGIFMDSHLALILNQIDVVAAGEVPEGISPETLRSMQKALTRNRKGVERYVFLHDISKADCLTLKFDSVEAARNAGLEDAQSDEVPVSWNQYQAMLRMDANGQKAVEGDEEAFRRWATTKQLTGVSYYHPDQKHGDAGSKSLREQGVDVDATMLVAIERHEDAYQFQKIDAERYLMLYAQINQEGRDYALLASYVDTAASLRPDGNPDLTNFQALAASKEKAELVPRLLVALGTDSSETDEALRIFVQNRVDRKNNPREPLTRLFKSVADGKLDTSKFSKFMESLFFESDAVGTEALQELLSRIANECALASYDREKLAKGVVALVDDTFSQDDANNLVELVMTDPDAVGKTFGRKLGRKMRQLQEILEAAKA